MGVILAVIYVAGRSLLLSKDKNGTERGTSCHVCGGDLESGDLTVKNHFQGISGVKIILC